MGGVHLVARPTGFISQVQGQFPVQKDFEPAYEAINAELDRLAELGGTCRPKGLEGLTPSSGTGLTAQPGLFSSAARANLLAVVPGPSGQAMHLSGLRQAGFLDAGHFPVSPSSQHAHEAIIAELDRLAQLGGSNKPTDVHPAPVLPLFQSLPVTTGQGGSADPDQEGGAKGKRFKPLSILLPDSAAAPPGGGPKNSSTPAGAAGATGGALHGPGAATLAGAGLPGAAHTPGSFTHRASLGIGGGLAEGMGLPSPALSPLMYGQDGLDFFLLSARGPGHLSDLKGGSLWSPSSGSGGLGSLPRPAHLGGFSDEAEGEDGGWTELGGGNAGIGDGEGLMVMGKSLSRAALSTLEHQEREGLAVRPSAQPQPQPPQPEPAHAQVPYQAAHAAVPGSVSSQQTQHQEDCTLQGQRGGSLGTDSAKEEGGGSGLRGASEGGGPQPMDLDRGMELPLDL